MFPALVGSGGDIKFCTSHELTGSGSDGFINQLNDYCAI